MTMNLQEVARLCNLTARASGKLPSLPLPSHLIVDQVHPSVHIAALVLGCISLALSIACMLFNLFSRNNRVVKMSSPRLNVVIACGGIVGSCACMMTSVDYFLIISSSIGHSVCQARASLLAVAFTLVFGPMVGKTWRVNQIFRLAGAKRVGTDFSTSLDVIPDSTGMLLVTDNRDLLTAVVGCTSQWSYLWTAAVFLYKAPFLVWGLREAWWTRGHILPAINDSACLAYSTLTTGSAILVYLFAVETFRKWPTVVGTCAVISIWLSVMVSIGFVFIPKVRTWRNTPKGERVRVSVSSVTNSMAFLQSFENIESELGQAHSEIDSLKTFIQQKELDMDKLQRLLSNAETSLAQIQLDHANVNIERTSPKLAGDRENLDRKLKTSSNALHVIDATCNSDKHEDNEADDEGKEGDDPQWSGPECPGSSSADEGGMTSEDVNSSLDNGGEFGLTSCCLHGKDCQGKAINDNDKEDGTCWYLPSDRGYAPAHLLANNRGRRHHHHHHHHPHRRRRRAGLSCPSGQGHSFRGRYSAPSAYNGIGHRAASSCGSSSVFTKGSSSKNATVNSNIYVHYMKRGGGIPVRRHSHGSIYSQQQHQQQHQLQHEQHQPRRLFDYTPVDRRLDMSAQHHLENRLEYLQPALSQFEYNTNDTVAGSRPNKRCSEHDSCSNSRPMSSKSKQRKRRRSSTPSVQSESSYTKLSKLRSDLNDAMAISRRLIGTWSVDSAPAGNDNGLAEINDSGKQMNTVKQRRTDNYRRQTVIGIQGIADSILESYSFQRTEDNHSFVYDCITPRRYTTSPSKSNKTSRSAVDNSTNIFSFNIDNSQEHVSNDFHAVEFGIRNTGKQFISSDNNLNKARTQSKHCSNSHTTTSFSSKLNIPPDSHTQWRSQSPSEIYDLPNNALKSGTARNYGIPNENVLSNINSMDNILRKLQDPGERQRSQIRVDEAESIVFLPPRNVSIQALLNQAHLHSAQSNGYQDTRLHTSQANGYHDTHLHTAHANNYRATHLHTAQSNGYQRSSDVDLHTSQASGFHGTHLHTAQAINLHTTEANNCQVDPFAETTASQRASTPCDASMRSGDRDLVLQTISGRSSQPQVQLLPHQRQAQLSPEALDRCGAARSSSNTLGQETSTHSMAFPQSREDVRPTGEFLHFQTRSGKDEAMKRVDSFA
ncbi:gamma-aminobutyric acid type b receptor subunit 2-like [Plakobranchus ocellatus]|uniref:Gamma-aminobutyric acid type b receptor subunit 2-like n=1 Tax=Plakobranchus ocellatus TaxID=259542 RepID=A0AAV3YPV8_9GAST|nr:gamma-aminobutyric acid type b receptor subunit 2-like [Plakobranchus ocellatus]